MSVPSPPKPPWRVEEFIDEMSYRHVVSQREEKKEFGFEPEEFLNCFKEKLKIIENKEKGIEGQLKRAHDRTSIGMKAHEQCAIGVGERFEKNMNKFGKLEGRISNLGGNTAVRIGENLENAHCQRKCAIETRELLMTLLLLNSNDCPSDGKALLDYFLAIDHSSSFHNQIESSSSDFSAIDSKIAALSSDESRVLFKKVDLFNKLKELCSDLKLSRMQKAKSSVRALTSLLRVKCLNNLQNGVSINKTCAIKDCIVILAHLGELRAAVDTYIDELDMFKKSTSKDSVGVDIPSLFEAIRLTADVHHSVFEKVFPHPETAAYRLAERIFTEKLPMHLSALLDNLTNDLSYLSTLEMAIQKTNHLVEWLEKEFMRMGGHIHLEALAEGLFSKKYRLGYLQREVGSLKSICREEMEKWNSQEGERSLTMVLSCIYAAEQSISRCLLISNPRDVPRHILVLFKECLLACLGHNYVLVLLTEVVNEVPLTSTQDYSKLLEVVGSFFEMTFFVNQIVVLLERHYHDHVLPHVVTSPNDHTSCEIAKDNLCDKLEGQILVGIDKCLSSIFTCVEKVLSSQKKTDFKIVDERINDPAFLVDNNPTPTCQTILAFFSHLMKLFQQTLDGKNRELLLEELGNRLYTLLLNHFKRFTVSQGLGGIQLLRDLTQYKESAQMFESESVQEKFDVLREIANLHLVAPQNLKLIMSESNLSLLDKQTLNSFIRLRSDYSMTWSGKYLLD